MTTEEFSDFLARRSEHLDDLILADIKPDIFEPTKTIPKWWHIRESVRKISEGIAFSQSRKVFDSPIECELPDRFHEIFPDMRAAWQDASIEVCRGHPCDPEA